MGQNNSQPKTPRQEIKGPPPRPVEPPSCKPISDLGPNGPSYYNPENKVLPSVLPSAKNLRPVSQELQQYHPDFKEIFRSDDVTNESENLPNNPDGYSSVINKENIVNGDMNGFVNGNVQVGKGDIYFHNGVIDDNGSVDTNNVNGDNKQRPKSVIVQGQKVKGHRRQMSASSSLYTKENTIQEDPNEPNIESRGKIDPFSLDLSFNPQVSIPVKPTFDMDTSYNLTYAQLAEARRNKTLQELEKKTGKKIEDLSADLAENADDGMMNFSRQPSTRSAKSSSSADSGLKKKRRAPPPPSQPPPPPLSQHAPSISTTGRSASTPVPPRPIQPPQKSYSFDSEPPIDYDIDIPIQTPSREVNRSQSLRSAQPNYAKSKPTPPPPPPPQSMQPQPAQSILRKPSTNAKSAGPHSSTSYDSPRNVPVRQPSFKSPPVLPPASMQAQQSSVLMEIQQQAENMSLRRQLSELSETKSAPTTPRSQSVDVTTELSETPKKEVLQNMVFESTPLYTPRSEEENKSTPMVERQNSNTSSTSSSAASSKAGDPNGAVRRLNSLLQHDIKLAAQAKATKIVKHTTPVKEKPKDPAAVFRETLAKAAAAREERCKNGKTIDAQLAEKQKLDNNDDESAAVFKTDEVVVKRTDSVKKSDKKEDKKEDKKDRGGSIKDDNDTEAFPKPKFIKKGSTKSLKSSKPEATAGSIIKNSRQRTPESDDENDVVSANMDYQSSIYAAKEWVPEDDLDSDDNIDDSGNVRSQSGHTEGFKTSIVPNKVKDLKSKGSSKAKDKKYTKKNSESSNDDKRKFDSIKRFKKSVHKNVKNAFGSISKASGKILKKQKSEELFENVPEQPRNWKLSNSSSEPNFGSHGDIASEMLSNSRPSSANARKYIVPTNDDEEDESSADESYADSSIKEESGKHDVSFTNGGQDDNDDSDDGDHTTMKRAGVAYVNKKGQIVLLPEYDTVEVDGQGNPVNDFEGRAPKINAKKKKFTFDATVRKKEREKVKEQVSAEAQEKEKLRDAEKVKESETEIEFKRIRELEARNRLQRLELQAQMQQQLLQQQQQMGYLSAPPLPPPTGFQQGYNPAAFDYSNLIGQSGLQQNGMTVPYGNPSTFTGPFFNAGVPGMSYDWSEYVRLMGVPAPQTNPQQYTYMLNSMNWPNAGIEMNKGSIAELLAYPNKLQQDDSQRNQVYQTWVGPTKQAVSKSQTDLSISQNPMEDNLRTQNIGDVNTVSGNVSSQYHYGANHANSDKRSSGGEKTNPLYAEDDSDVSDGLSPQKSEASMVARVHVKDYREVPSYGNGRESGIFKSSISVPNLSTTAVGNGDIR